MKVSNVSEDVIRILAQAGHAAASADNSQPWNFIWDGQYFNVNFRTASSTVHSPTATSMATLLAVGSVIENIVQMGKSLGLDLLPDLEYSGPTGSGMHTYARFLIEAQAHTQSGDLSHPLFQRHTNRFCYQSTALPAALFSELKDMTEGSAHIALVDDVSHIQHIATLIKQASEVRFRVQEAHEWLAGSLRFKAADSAEGNGMEVSTLNLPPGGRLFLRLTRSWRVMTVLNKLGAYKFMAGSDASPVINAPALAVVKAAATRTGALEAGRLLTRAWIHLNEQDIAAHPYFVITDQLDRLRSNTLPAKLHRNVTRIAEECPGIFQLRSEEALYMVLRVGYPCRVTPRSKRVPLEQVLVNLPAGEG